MLVVELAALFHDLYAMLRALFCTILMRHTKLIFGCRLRHDSKYAKLTQSVWDDLNSRFFAEQIQAGRISEDEARLVSKICENVSYSKEVKRIKAVSSPHIDILRVLMFPLILRARKLHGMTSASSCIACRTRISWMRWAVGAFFSPLAFHAHIHVVPTF